MNARAAAARIITAVLTEGAALNENLLQQFSKDIAERDYAFVKECCYGVLRFYWQLNALSQKLLRKPFKTKDSDLQALILVGLYQLLYLRTPAHAAVSETVAAVKALKKFWAKNLINAVLRSFQRQKEELLAALKSDEHAYYAHPKWLLSQLKQAWPTQWQAIVAANNQQAPMSLRVNLLKTTRKDYLKRLAATKINAQPSELVATGVVLAEPIDVKQLPGFAAGEVAVQDEAAQLAAELLALKPDLHVLDACAAPGGKTAHILETQPELKKLIALDCDKQRLKKVTDNLQRLELTAELICADATETKKWWDGELFDRILLDAPCSGTGVIRRHPDIKVLRQPSDIINLAQLQQKLLQALWPLLKPGGLLVYATCSVLPAENSELIKRCLQDFLDASEKPITATWGEQQTVGRQLLPKESGCDGFYYACLEKHSRHSRDT